MQRLGIEWLHRLVTDVGRSRQRQAINPVVDVLPVVNPVNDDICAVLERTKIDGARERRVDDERHARFLR